MLLTTRLILANSACRVMLLLLVMLGTTAYLDVSYFKNGDLAELPAVCMIVLITIVLGICVLLLLLTTLSTREQYDRTSQLLCTDRDAEVWLRSISREGAPCYRAGVRCAVKDFRKGQQQCLR